MMSISSGFYKIPLKRFERDVFPSLTNEIERHKQKLHQSRQLCDWAGVRAELTASRATSSRLRQSLADLDRVQAQLSSPDRAHFDSSYGPMRAEALRLSEKFSELLLFFETVCDGAATTRHTSTVSGENADSHHSPQWSQQQQLQQQQQQQQLQQFDLVESEEQILRQRRIQLQQYNRLNSDLEQLNEIMCDMAAVTQTQSVLVDRVERHVTEADINVADGCRQLAVGARYAGVMAPATGALIGGLVAGPVGALAGAKVGALALVGGGFIGYMGGRLVNHARAGTVPTQLPSSVSAPAGLGVTSTTRCPSRSSFKSFFSRKRTIPTEVLDPVLADDVEYAHEALPH